MNLVFHRELGRNRHPRRCILDVTPSNAIALFEALANSQVTLHMRMADDSDLARLTPAWSNVEIPIVDSPEKVIAALKG